MARNNATILVKIQHNHVILPTLILCYPLQKQNPMCNLFQRAFRLLNTYN